MSTSEFDLIRQYFGALGASREDVILGIGDDCALLDVGPDRQLAVSMDTLVEGRHFSPGTDPYDLGQRVLAVNLSDLAAMGAEPAWFTLGLTLPDADPVFLETFSRGMAKVACEHGVQLVGGDTTAGPLTVTVQVHGFVPRGRALRRDGAAAGDLVYLTGSVGDAGLALLPQAMGALDEASRAAVAARLHRPQARVGIGKALVGLASAAIDVSDGLAADLGHICERSGLAAVIDRAAVPLSDAVRAYIAQGGDADLPLSAGDDYELVFTVAPAQVAELQRRAADWDVPASCIGVMQAGTGVTVRERDGRLSIAPGGYDHFR